MDILKGVFARKRVREESLIPYGFVAVANGYRFEQNFLCGDFHAIVSINSNGKASGTVIDVLTGETYQPIGIAAYDGAFVNTVRNEYVRLLTDIAENCFDTLLFSSEQANRITKLISEKYGDTPDFPWEGDLNKENGVFRHEHNKKWYALIMNIKLSILDKECEPSTRVNVINVKTEADKSGALCEENGVFPAYHMNHRCWLTLVLNDTLTDERIMALIEESYLLTNK